MGTGLSFKVKRSHAERSEAKNFFWLSPPLNKILDPPLIPVQQVHTEPSSIDFGQAMSMQQPAIPQEPPIVQADPSPASVISSPTALSQERPPAATQPSAALPLQPSPEAQDTLHQKIAMLEQSLLALAEQNKQNKSSQDLSGTNPLLLTNLLEDAPPLAKASAPQLANSIPLHSLVSSDLKAKIKKGDFVEFYGLLNPTEGKVYGIKGKETDLGFITSLSEVQPKA